MDSGHSRGDRRLDRERAAESWPSEPEEMTFRQRGRRVSRGVDDPLDTGEWLRTGGLDSPGPSDFDVSDYERPSLLSGPGAELYGMGGGGYAGSDSSFSSFDDRYSTAYSTEAYSSGPPSGELPSPTPRPRHYRDEEPEEEETSSGLVRPYFRTRGRTKPDYDLALESLISTSERGRRLERVRVPEHRSICGLCLDTRSVAEVAALLKMPLGVVRVLVGDVAGLGLVLVHSASSSMVGDRPSIEFMERVLSGLRRI